MSRSKRGLGCAVGVFFFLILLAAGIIVGLKLYERYGPSYEMADKEDVFQISGGQAAILLNGELQESKGIFAEGQVYLPVSWVNQAVNQRFYWDSGEGILVYTLPEEIVYADAETEGESGHLLQVREGEAYLSLGLIANYSDIRVQAFDTSEIKRVFIDTLWEPLEQASVQRGGMVRVRGGVKSQVICEAQKGDTVTVLERMDRWSKVRTADGYVGYIENRRLKEAEPLTPQSSFTEPVYTNISMEEPIVLAFHQVFVQDANQNMETLMEAAAGKVNVIVPTWFVVLDSEGNYSSIASKDYVDKAHEMGMQVWAMLNNVSTEESTAVDIEKLMSSTSTREKMIESLMEDAKEYGFDGINLDFESLRSQSGPHYVQFIRELSVACRKAGLVLSIDNYVPSAYTEFYNRREQGTVADYVIIMGYDEHYAGGEPGPVASISFVENGIRDTLEQVPKEKVINAIPFYTRLWTSDGDSHTSQVFDMEEQELWLQEHSLTPQWQEELGLYYAQRQGDEGLEQLWMEEERSLGEKLGLVKEYELAGAAFWKLGFEKDEVWDQIGEIF